MRNHFPLV